MSNKIQSSNIFNDIRISLDIKEVLRRQGMARCTSPRPEIAALTTELLAITDRLHLLEPALAYESYSITNINRDSMNLHGGFILNGTLLPVKFREASKLAVIVCTIGPKLEEAVSGYFHRDEALRGTLLDGIGNAALDSVVREACRLVKNDASSQGYLTTGPVSPGIPGFTLSEQPAIFKLVSAEHIGVHLTTSGVMFPRKSISLVAGMGIRISEGMQDNGCVDCNMGLKCAYRMVTSV